MLGRFYGLTGITLTLSPVSVTSYKKLVSAMDTSANRAILSVLKRDLFELINFLDNFPIIYKDSKLEKISTYLKLNKYKNEEEKLDWERQLEGADKIISKRFRSAKLGNVILSDTAHSVIQELINNKNRAVFFHNAIEYSNENSGVIVFGEKLYILRNRGRSYLDEKMKKLYSGSSLKFKLPAIKKDLSVLENYIGEGTPTNVESNLSYESDNMKQLVSNLDEDYFNTKLDLDLTNEEYYNLSVELMDLGLFGFSVYSKEMYCDFEQSVSFAGGSDINIYQTEKPGLYGLILDLKEVVENFDCLERGTYE